MDDLVPRVWKTVAIICVIALGGAYVLNWMEVDSKGADLARLQRLLRSAKQSLESARARFATAEDGRSAQLKHESAVTAVSELRAEILRLEASRSALLKKYAGSVLAIRSKAAGADWQDIRLLNGSTLTGVKIQRVDGNAVLVSHSGGYAKLSGEDVPSELKQMLRLDMPLTSYAGTDQPAGDTAESPPGAAPQPSDTSAAIPPLDKVSKIQIDIDTLSAQIKKLSDQRLRWLARGRALRSEISDTKTAGRPTYNLTAEASKAAQSLQLVDAELSKLEDQLLALRRKLTEAQVANP